MSNYLYNERGHSLNTTRGKNDLLSKIVHDPKHTQLLKEIDNWGKDHRHLYPTLQEFSDWWKGVWADFNDDLEDIMEYLDGLCGQCLDEVPGCACGINYLEGRMK